MQISVSLGIVMKNLVLARMPVAFVSLPAPQIFITLITVLPSFMWVVRATRALTEFSSMIARFEWPPPPLATCAHRRTQKQRCVEDLTEALLVQSACAIIGGWNPPLGLVITPPAYPRSQAEMDSL